MDKQAVMGLMHLYVTVFLSYFSVVMVAPAITDVTMAALCPGKDQCSLAIYLSGFQQSIIGVGTLVMMPLIGNLSDIYGRKALLTIPLTLSIIPLVILAWSRTTGFFYAYYVFRTLTGMVSEGSIQCLAIAYVADNVSEGQRASAFGMVLGITCASFVGATLTARLLSTDHTFKVATIVSMVALVYMRIFLKDTNICDGNDSLGQPILKTTEEDTMISDGETSDKVQVFKKNPSLKDFTFLLKRSWTFSLAALVAFFSGLSKSGFEGSSMYFFKARLHYNKDEFANLLIILGIAGMVSQMLFMPVLIPVMGEQKLLSLGLFVGFLSMLVDSIVWAAWVPYVVAAFATFSIMETPCLRSIVSKQVGPNEQGMAQGCFSGIASFASIISPLMFSPLTDLFLSDGAPFSYPGFSILCMGLASLIAFIPSIMIRAVPRSDKVDCSDC